MNFFCRHEEFRQHVKFLKIRYIVMHEDLTKFKELGFKLVGTGTVMVVHADAYQLL